MNMRFVKFFSLLLAVIALYPAAHLLCKKATDDFTIWGISSKRPFTPSFETRPLSDEEQGELSLALGQPYKYLGCGGQSFIFLSQDGHYVIKFFKQRVFTVPFWIQHFPIPYIIDRYREKKIAHREDKIRRDFASYKIAFEEMPQDTGVVYIHLNPSNHLLNSLTIVDKLHIAHSLDLNRFDFVVQRRADHVYDRISALMKRGETEKAKKAIDSLIDLIVTRSKRGYHDRDPNIRTNCGFLGEKAIKIDVGRLVKEDCVKQKKVFEKEFIRIMHPFEDWLRIAHPELALYVQEKINETLVNFEEKP